MISYTALHNYLLTYLSPLLKHKLLEGQDFISFISVLTRVITGLINSGQMDGRIHGLMDAEMDEGMLSQQKDQRHIQEILRLEIHKQVTGIREPYQWGILNWVLRQSPNV